MAGNGTRKDREPTEDELAEMAAFCAMGAAALMFLQSTPERWAPYEEFNRQFKEQRNSLNSLITREMTVDAAKYLFGMARTAAMHTGMRPEKPK